MTPSTTSLAMAWTSELAHQEIRVPWLQCECARLQHNVNAQHYNANLKSYDANGQGYDVNTDDCHIPRLPNPNVHAYDNEDNTSRQPAGATPPVNGGGIAEATNVEQVAQRKRRHVARGRNELSPPKKSCRHGTWMALTLGEDAQAKRPRNKELRYIGTEDVSRRVLVHPTALLRFYGDFTTVFEPITSDLRSSGGDIDAPCRVRIPALNKIGWHCWSIEAPGSSIEGLSGKFLDFGLKNPIFSNILELKNPKSDKAVSCTKFA
ncbi:hypothetical protein DFH07DRAFT_779309 [Mycena maculata]|uniref:Uncharacterized protein n=1 Tax=Mycena maculata TaxID=230809 RepID=A0AAD7MZI8_9AGAR|nr:hypothetical protein DFH07DRAFT_779309 [Mycena maculata]